MTFFETCIRLLDIGSITTWYPFPFIFQIFFRITPTNQILKTYKLKASSNRRSSLIASNN